MDSKKNWANGGTTEQTRNANQRTSVLGGYLERCLMINQSINQSINQLCLMRVTAYSRSKDENQLQTQPTYNAE